MRKILVIAVREFRAAVLNKAFMISVIMMPVMIAISAAASRMADTWKTHELRTIAIVDRTPGKGVEAVATLDLLRSRETADDDEPAAMTGSLARLRFESVPPPADDAAALQTRYELGRRVAAGELAAFFDIGPAALDAAADDPRQAAVTYYTDRALDRDVLLGVGVKLLTLVQLQRSAGQNPLLLLRQERRYAPEEVVGLLEAAARTAGGGLVQRDLPSLDAAGRVIDGREVRSGLRPMIPMLATLLLLMVVIIGASPQLQGVIEEKMNRIGELLLGSARPFQILAGKLLGMSATGLVLSVIYLGGALLAARQWNLAGDLRWDLPLWFIVFQVLALLLYGSLFVAVGSACSDMKQAQTLLMPVSIALSLPVVLAAPVMEDPTGMLARVASLVPLATPTLMMCRVAAAPNLPLWEPLLGVVLVLITTVISVWIAGRIFRIGYLSTGKAPTMMELVRWVAGRV